MGYQLHDKNFVMQSVFHNHKSFVIKTVTQLPAIREILKQKLVLQIALETEAVAIWRVEK